jgi:hypothetical protein
LPALAFFNRKRDRQTRRAFSGMDRKKAAAPAQLLLFTRPSKTRASIAFSNVLKIPTKWSFFHEK